MDKSYKDSVFRESARTVKSFCANCTKINWVVSDCKQAGAEVKREGGKITSCTGFEDYRKNELTKYEEEMSQHLKRGSIDWEVTTTQETQALNRLVKKGYAKFDKKKREWRYEHETN